MRLVPALALIFAALLLVPRVLASSEQVYKDYLYQYDQYRSKYNDFKVAKNEYDKFKTLTSETEALAKTKVMLEQRDILLKTYLLYLSEKLIENRGLSDADRSLFQTLIRNENTFLTTHSDLVASIGSIDDAEGASRQLESHYRILSISIRQIINGISLGDLAVLAGRFDKTFADVTVFFNSNRSAISVAKQGVADRWIDSITNKRSLYQQKVNDISRRNFQMKGASLQEIDRFHGLLRNDINSAKTYLTEATANLTELLNSMRYVY
ncbi:hypothetical protein A2Z33_00925 [Candidatus Gottesmanbacteria bacterium RBG_16_52_11]|uniref:HBM domain-containing protein n=1 Tax=Candidatus Gottesmanbacteria bacterium RBG_16_52_11 TaxID=1798374 RepID=A0A1F5YNM5_9BACT|nr:MAG: hypothetical protein A2Z33_00925 [Candidatus Gottesmanbacteria bacterium RBG_16_52_11]